MSIIGLIAKFLVGRGVQSRFAAPLAWLATAVSAVLALLSAWGLITLLVHRHDHRVINAYENGVEARVENQANAADAKMDERKVSDEANISADREEFNNATANLPRTGLTDRQRIDACRELRDQGTDKAVLARAGCV